MTLDVSEFCVEIVNLVDRNDTGYTVEQDLNSCHDIFHLFPNQIGCAKNQNQVYKIYLKNKYKFRNCRLSVNGIFDLVFFSNKESVKYKYEKQDLLGNCIP